MNSESLGAREGRRERRGNEWIEPARMRDVSFPLTGKVVCLLLHCSTVSIYLDPTPSVFLYSQISDPRLPPPLFF